MKHFLDRATFYSGDLMGWVTQRVRDVEITEGVPYAQYTRAVKVVYTPKGKRKKRVRFLTYKPELVVVHGWSAPEFDARVMERIDEMTSRSRHTACSPAWGTEFDAWLKQQEVNIMKVPERLPPGILLRSYTTPGHDFQYILAADGPGDPSSPKVVECCGSSVPLPLPLPEIPQDVEERLNRYAAELGVDKAAWRLTAGLK